MDPRYKISMSYNNIASWLVTNFLKMASIITRYAGKQIAIPKDLDKISKISLLKDLAH